MKQNEKPLLFRSCLSLLVIIISTILTGLAACKEGGKKDKMKSPPGYDLTQPIEIKLPLELDEISGLIYYSKDTSVMAINDEHGWLYKIYLKHPQQIQKWKFSSGADFEDLVLRDSVFYTLQSNGNMVVYKFINADSLYLQEFEFPFGKGNEFEAAYLDSSSDKLVLICKDCKSDTKDVTTTYTFDPLTFQYRDSSFTIDASRILKLSKDDKKFKPSAAAIHPVTGELYIISSVNAILVVADLSGKVNEIYPLDHKIFKQPEGLCFTKNGSLLISNEAAEVGVANILIFPYYKPKTFLK
jgi:hypothetical protein